MHITILIPVYNGIEFLEECIDSVKVQTHSDWDILIGVNGHGPEGGHVAKQARQIASSDSRIRVIVQPPPLEGKSASLNDLLNYVRGEWVCLLDCDDTWMPTKLTEQIQAFEGKAKGALVIGTFCEYFGTMQGSPAIPGEWIHPAVLQTVNPIINSSSLIHRSLCYWEGKYTEDYHLWMRLALLGIRLYNVPRILVRHRIHPTSAYNSAHVSAEPLQKWYKEQCSKYCITTFCYGDRYRPVKKPWEERCKRQCKTASIVIHEDVNVPLRHGMIYGWWDIVRLFNNLSLLQKTQKPVVHVDLDIILEKDIQPLVDLQYDCILSTEIGGDRAYPPESSKIIGFGICSGFYILKPSSHAFFSKLLSIMSDNPQSSSDQVNLMNYITTQPHRIYEDIFELDGKKYTNKIIEMDGIKLCVLDFEIIIRDPIVSNGQFGNHINIDNVGGVSNFLRYFDNPLDQLPLTCRCGKAHLGDTNVCKHIQLRRGFN